MINHLSDIIHKIQHDPFYKGLSTFIGVLCAIGLYTSLHPKEEFKIKLPPATVKFEFSDSSATEQSKMGTKDPEKIDKKDELTPKNPSPTDKPTPTPKVIKEKKKVDAAENSLTPAGPEKLETPVSADSDKGNTANLTSQQHIEVETPNKIIETGGTFGSGAPEVILAKDVDVLLKAPKIDASKVDTTLQTNGEKIEVAPGASDKPPMPSADAIDQSVYSDSPGGDVVILKLKINDRGEVIDVRISVPSKYPVDDFGIAMSARNAKFNKFVPPLRPGEIREIEVRVPYIVESLDPSKKDTQKLP